ncbi:hypothetical protein FRC15_008985 [Serendipita sp. 397]|nr:hypothetical protein FRC15_008985 [Serendipita sp. 397]
MVKLGITLTWSLPDHASTERLGLCDDMTRLPNGDQMSFQTLPIEVIISILTLSLDVHPIPSNILRVHSTWNKALAPILTSHIRLGSLTQLYFFVKTSKLHGKPKAFSLRLPGGSIHFTGRARAEATLAAFNSGHAEEKAESDWIKAKIIDNGGIWACLRLALLKCPVVERISLQLHSFLSDPDLPKITNALNIVNPRSFKWTGPDPGHHISAAIVPKATEHLFRAIKSWTKLEQLTLTNVSFPSPPSICVLTGAFAFHSHPVLREIHIGQAVFVTPESVAALIMNISSLETLTLEDTYSASIWEARIRQGNVLATLKYLNDDDERKKRVNQVLRCTARLERIIGGDRG